MGKGDELWEDSALVDAFDHAVATYRAMHGKHNQASPSEKKKSEEGTAGEEPVSTEAADDYFMQQTMKNPDKVDFYYQKPLLTKGAKDPFRFWKN